MTKKIGPSRSGTTVMMWNKFQQLKELGGTFSMHRLDAVTAGQLIIVADEMAKIDREEQEAREKKRKAEAAARKNTRRR